MKPCEHRKRRQNAWKLWARGRLDIGWSDLLFAVGTPLLPGVSPRRVWPTQTPHIAALSVRTAWDALLRSRDWAQGSEIILSEANIPDMVRIIEENGFVPVVVPLDIDTLRVEASAVRAAVSERTRAILVSPLFGSRMALGEIADIAREHGLLLVEDNAQGFSDTSFRGSLEADVTLFSFGTIKTRTALGGAVVFARDPQLLQVLERQMRGYPRVSTLEFYRKWARAIALQCLGHRLILGMVWRVLERRGINPDIRFSQMTRGVVGSDLLTAIRRQPHRGTLKLLRRRLREMEDANAKARTERGVVALGELDCVLGAKTPRPFFWALPVVVRNREGLIEEARREGFDLSFRASSVVCHGMEPTAFSQALERAVYLPIGTPMAKGEWRRLLGIVREYCNG